MLYLDNLDFRDHFTVGKLLSCLGGLGLVVAVSHKLRTFSLPCLLENPSGHYLVNVLLWMEVGEQWDD